jgi:hypothetical protein
MKTILAAAAFATFAAGSADAATTPSAGPAPAIAAPVAGSVFAELEGLGYDLGKFKPDYAGRFPNSDA